MTQFALDNSQAYSRACSEGMVSVKRGHLTVLGSGGDGKTSFIDRLTGRGFNTTHTVTEGIEAELSCTIDTVNCTEAWTEHNMDQAEVLKEAITTGFSNILDEFQQLDIEASQISHDHTRTVIDTAEMNTTIDTNPPQGNARSFNERSNYFSDTAEPPTRSDTNLEGDSEAKKQLEQVYIYSKRSNTTTQADIEIVDFGGQWMYKTIHHVFVRNKCVFALVINLNIKLNSVTTLETKPKLYATNRTFFKWFQPMSSRSQILGNVRYIDQIVMWLNTILSHMRTNDNSEYMANTLIIGTHTDLLGWSKNSRKVSAEKYFTELRELLKSKAHKQMIRGFYAVDNRYGDPETFKEVRQEIMKAIEENCDWNQKRPIKWLQMEKHLHDIQNVNNDDDVDQNLIRFEDAEKYGERFRIDRDDMAAFCNFHHMRGDITYLQTEALKGYIIANPQWLVNVFRTIITLPMYRPTDRPELQDEISLLEHDGILKPKGTFLRHVWKQFLDGKEDIQERIEYLIQLLVHFDITCPLKNGSNSEESIYLVPCLLPWCLEASEPDSEWKKALPALCFRFHNSMDSYHATHLDTAPVDLFLPFAFFQRLVCRCSKQPGWTFTSTKYQNKMSFLIGDQLVILQTHFQSVWIKLSILTQEAEESSFSDNVASEVYLAVTKHINTLIECYHSNMWYEVCLSPCENVQIQGKTKKAVPPSVFEGDHCLIGTGVTSLSPNASLKLVQCKFHRAILPIKCYEAWFQASPDTPSQPSGAESNPPQYREKSK